MERGSRNAAICASSLVTICILLWALLLAFPYWSYPHALHTLFTAVLTPCCLLLPIVFFFGYGARSGEAQALHEVAAEAHVRIQALTRGPHHLPSTHKPAQPAASPAITSQSAECRTQAGQGASHQHALPEASQPLASSVMCSGAPLDTPQLGLQGDDEPQHQTSRHGLSQPTASSAIPRPSAQSEAQPGSPSKQEACHEPSHSDSNHSSAARQAAHFEDESEPQTEVPGPFLERDHRHMPSQAQQSENVVHQGSMGALSSTSATPLLSTPPYDNKIMRNSMQDTALPMRHMPADAVGNEYRQQQVGSSQIEQAAAFHQQQQDMPSTADELAEEGERAMEPHTAAGSPGHEGLHPHLKRSIDLPPSEGPALKKPSHSSATGGPHRLADNEARQSSQNGLQQPAVSDARQASAVNHGWSLPTSREVVALHEPPPIPVEADPPARSRSPFDRLRLEALTQGPSDGGPEPFPNADTFRSNREDHSSPQPNGTNHVSISRQQQDSFSFPPLSDGEPARRRSPVVSMEPTRAAAGAFGSSVLNYDHQLQQRPGLLTSSSPLLTQEPPVTRVFIGNDVNQAKDGDLAAGIHDAYDSASGSEYPLSIENGPILTYPSIQARDDLRDTAGDVSVHATPVSSSLSRVASDHGTSPLHDAEAPPGAALPPVSLTAKQYGHIRSGRLGEEGEGSDSSGTCTPVHGQGTGSPMKAMSGGQDMGLMHDLATSGRSPSPLGVIRAGRLGE